MKALATLFSLAVLGTASAQQLPALSAAQPVDIRVKSVQWHPHGNALLYTREEESGIGIGLYRLDDLEGNVLLHLAKADNWRAEWFEGAASALVFVKHKVQTGQGPGTEADVYLLDGKQKTANEVFSRIVPASDKIEIDADTSPSLTHAIFNVHEGKRFYHVVLPINGGRLLASADIDQAVAEGFAGPSWSKDGTAIYAKQAGNPQGLTFKLRAEQALNDARNGELQYIVAQNQLGSISSDAQKVRVDLVQGELATYLAEDLLFRLAPAAPPAGIPVLEVVPSNGVLRQVLSPGPWVEPPAIAKTMKPTSHPVSLDFGPSRGGANSLWLTNGNKQNPMAVLVAAHADEAHLAPQEKAIAYITDQALFVRKIGVRDASR